MTFSGDLSSLTAATAAAEFVGYVGDVSVGAALFADALAADPTRSTPPAFPVSPSVDVAVASRRWPVAWAATAAAAVDPCAADADEVLEVFLGDRRHTVRSELACVAGLPRWAAERVVVEGFAARDAASVDLALRVQEFSAFQLVELFGGERVVSLSEVAMARFAAVVAADESAAVRFVARAASRELVVEVLRASLRRCAPAGPGGVQAVAADPSYSSSALGAHFCDLVDVVLGRERPLVSLSDVVGLVLRFPALADVRLVEWLVSQLPAVAASGGSVVAEVRPESLRELVDPELISVWWRSGVRGARAALLSERHPTTLAVAEVLAGEALAECAAARSGDLPALSVERADELVELAVRMCSFDRNAWPAGAGVGPESLPRSVGVLGLAVELLEAAREVGAYIPGLGAMRCATLGVELVAAGVGLTVAVPALVRFAEWAPKVVGPLLVGLDLSVALPPASGSTSGSATGSTVSGSVPAVDLAALRAETAEVLLLGLLRAVAARPAWFGVVAGDVLHCAHLRAWAAVSEGLWVMLVGNTPGLAGPAVDARLSWLSRAAVSALELRLGADVDAWRAALLLVPSWEGSLFELAEVAATFNAA